MIDKYRILTPKGWAKFDGIRRKYSDNFIKLNFDENKFICTIDHLLLDDTNNYIEAQNSLNKKIIGKNGVFQISAIEKVKSQYAYDILNVEFDNQYYTDNFISHNCSFIGSSGTLIAGWKLKELVAQTPLEIKLGNFQYKLPEKDHQYMCLADVSEGKGFDYSAFHIIDITKMPYEQVYVYRSNTVAYADYAQTIHRIATLYNNAHVLVENNNIGGQVVNSIALDLEYENVIQTANKGAEGKVITNGWNGGTGERGVRMSTSVKATGASMLKLIVEQNQILIHDENTIFELSTFIRKGKSWQADEGKHDDLAMGLLLFGWMTNQKYFKEITDINTLNKLRDKPEEELAEDLMSFGIPIEESENNFDDIKELGFAYSDDVDWVFH